MPDKKLPDNEIVKALEWYVSKFKKVGFVYMDADGTKLVSTQEVLDLINRLQAEVENYKQIAENQQKVTLDKAFENKRLKEKVESLQAEKEALIAGQETLQKYIAEQKAENERLKGIVNIVPNATVEMLEEFAEQVKMAFYYEFDELIPSIMADKIDNLLKELVGEDNG